MSKNENQKFKAIIENQPAIPNLQAELELIYRKMWVSVNDRMPTDQYFYLVVAYGIPYLAYWSNDMWRGSDDYPVHSVTHWMPIIKPEVSK